MSVNRIASLRNAANISRAEIAERLGVTERTVYRWEHGEVQIPDDQKLALSTLFNVPVSYLMAWEESEGNGNGDETNGDSKRGVA